MRIIKMEKMLLPRNLNLKDMGQVAQEMSTQLKSPLTVETGSF